MAWSTNGRSRRIPWRWVIVVLLAGAAAGLGLVGFHQYYADRGQAKSVASLLYVTLQLFTLESGNLDAPLNPSLEIARFLAPVAAGYAVVIALLRLFSVQVQRAWVRLRGKHVILCGLGRKGVRLVEQLRARRERVVVIEPDEENTGLERCRELGCVVIVGRADDEWNLRKAHLDHARLLIAVAGEDGVNVETAVRAHDLVQQRRGVPLQCILHVWDPDLQTLLRQHQLFTDENDPFHLEFFNAYEVGARVMLQEFGAWDAARRAGPHGVHLLIIGLGRLGETLLLRAIKDWRVDPPAGAGTLHITVVDIRASEQKTWIEQRYPELAKAAQLEFVSLDVRSPLLARGNFLQVHPGPPSVTAAFVCLDDDANAMYAALALRQCLGQDVPLMVRMSEEAGLATLLGTQEHRQGVIPGVLAVGLMDIACSLEFVLGGTREVLARAVHEGYLQDQLAAGQTPATNPSLKPWHHLPEDLRESNRQQADDMRDKLKAIGCTLVPCPTGVERLFQFAPAELERLAEMEHQRWVEERRQAGWKRGPQKDAERRITPYLVPWSELAEDVRELDRNAVRRIPRILAKADYAIRRRP